MVCSSMTRLCYIICSNFGHLQQWIFCPKPKICQRRFETLPNVKQTLKNCLSFYKLAKVATFFQIWSHRQCDYIWHNIKLLQKWVFIWQNIILFWKFSFLSMVKYWTNHCDHLVTLVDCRDCVIECTIFRRFYLACHCSDVEAFYQRHFINYFNVEFCAE